MEFNVDIHKEAGRRRQGEPLYVRRSKHWEVFMKVDPDQLRQSEKPPAHVQAALEDVMGRDRMKDLKLRVHPHLRRWCLFERIKDPQSGQTNAWAVVSTFQGEAREGWLPPDIQDRPNIRHLTGEIGEFRMPTKRDFEIIEQYDKKKYGYKEVDKLHLNQEQKEKDDKNFEWDDYSRDFLDYNFWLACRDAQAHYSKGMYSVPTVAVKSSPAKYHKEWMATANGGYWVTKKITKEQYVDQILKDYEAFKSALRDAGLSRSAAARIRLAHEEFRAAQSKSQNSVKDMKEFKEIEARYRKTLEGSELVAPAKLNDEDKEWLEQRLKDRSGSTRTVYKRNGEVEVHRLGKLFREKEKVPA